MNKTTQINYHREDARHILVVDDESHVGLFIDVFLSSRGFTVTRHVDGKEALSQFAEHPWMFDMVLTDQNMPGMSGTELAKNLLAIRPDVPVLLCTGFATDDIKRCTRDVGIMAYISKPLNVNHLLRYMEECLDNNDRPPADKMDEPS